MAFNVNPLMAEYAGISPGLKAAMASAGQAPPMNAPAITPQMKTDAQPMDAGPAPELAGIHMPDANPFPQLGSPPSPNVSPAIKGTLPGDQLERQRLMETGSGESQIMHRIEGSGFGQNHPLLGKILGGAAQGAATLGDIGLSAVAPGIAMNLPGTEYHHQELLRNANHAVTQDEANAGKEAQTANENATAQHTEAETPTVAPLAASRESMEGAQTAHDNAETATLPQAEADKHSLVAPTIGHLNAESASLAHPKVTPEQDAYDKAFKELTGKGLSPSQAVEKLKEKPPSINLNAGEKEGQNFFVPDGQGGTRMIRVKPGDTVPAGAQSASGLNAVNTPTTQQRTAAGRAETVVAMAPEVLSRIDALAPKMGPIAGRWNDFMQGKVGSDDPDFAGLRSDLLMMSSAVALAHAQGRLPENLRLEFDRAINAPKQTPENLKATINTMLPWLQKMQGQGQPNAPKGNETAPQDMITVQIPGQAPGQIHASQKAAFMAKYPNAKVQ